MSSSINIILVETHTIIRNGLRHILTQHPDFSVVGDVNSDLALKTMWPKLSCDILILDVSLNKTSGFSTLDYVLKKQPQQHVLMLSTYPDSHYGKQSISSGAKGYLSKDCNCDELIEALQCIAKGKTYINARLTHPIHAFSTKTEILSSRESEVFKLIGEGRSNNGIAQFLNLSPKTVSTYRTRILEKLHLSSTADVIKYYLTNTPSLTRI